MGTKKNKRRMIEQPNFDRQQSIIPSPPQWELNGHIVFDFSKGKHYSVSFSGFNNHFSDESHVRETYVGFLSSILSELSNMSISQATVENRQHYHLHEIRDKKLAIIEKY